MEGGRGKKERMGKKGEVERGEGETNTERTKYKRREREFAERTMEQNFPPKMKAANCEQVWRKAPVRREQ